MSYRIWFHILITTYKQNKKELQTSSIHKKAVTQVSHTALNVKYMSALKEVWQFNACFENIMKQQTNSQNDAKYSVPGLYSKCMSHKAISCTEWNSLKNSQTQQHYQRSSGHQS